VFRARRAIAAHRAATGAPRAIVASGEQPASPAAVAATLSAGSPRPPVRADRRLPIADRCRPSPVIRASAS
jgi:hypothetical protein